MYFKFKYIFYQCATFGASACYGLSYTFGRGIVAHFFPSQLINFKKKVWHSINFEIYSEIYLQVIHNIHNLFWYMLFLRITPLVPNWFVNISSPIVGIPFSYFFFGTLFGFKSNLKNSQNFNKKNKRVDACECYSCQHRTCSS